MQYLAQWTEIVRIIAPFFSNFRVFVRQDVQTYTVAVKSNVVEEYSGSVRIFSTNIMLMILNFEIVRASLDRCGYFSQLAILLRTTISVDVTILY